MTWNTRASRNVWPIVATLPRPSRPSRRRERDHRGGEQRRPEESGCEAVGGGSAGHRLQSTRGVADVVDALPAAWSVAAHDITMKIPITPVSEAPVITSMRSSRISLVGIRLSAA